MSKESFSLIDEPIPKGKRLPRGSKYDDVIEEFLARPAKSSRVIFRDKKGNELQPSTVLAGIKNRIDALKVKDKIDVVLRSKKVYLRKKSKA